MARATIRQSTKRPSRPETRAAGLPRRASNGDPPAEVIDAESLPWIPFEPHSADVMVKYFRLDPVLGEIVMLVKAPAGATLPRMHQCGRTMVYTLEGRWKQRENDWIAGPGSVVLGPAASRHTLAVVAADVPVRALVIAVGDLLFLGQRGEVLAIENWKTAHQRYLAYCARSAIVPRDLTLPANAGSAR